MDALAKLRLLSDASKYDLSCACGTADHDHRKRGNDGAWLYPVSLPSGGQSIMLKSLISNVCVNDCKYCPCRSGLDIPRCSLTPDQMASLFMWYAASKNILGLFLTSGVVAQPDASMRLLNDTAAILRYRHQYRGYIHLKVIPGASTAAIAEALSLASAVSLNIETPGEKHCARLSQRKNFMRDIIAPLKTIHSLTARGNRYEGVKTTTQFIVGASDETDMEIVQYVKGLYDRMGLHRIYFSAYQKGAGDRSIPGEQDSPAPAFQPFVREHRLYQTDFLFRKYGFASEDIVFEPDGNLSLEKDPKQVWADHHQDFFPVNCNLADKADLLRVPGIGPTLTRRIMAHRTEGKIRSWERLGIRGWRKALVERYAVCG
jgi:predicted DNA-binding helix-hairpin-helix protein